MHLDFKLHNKNNQITNTLFCTLNFYCSRIAILPRKADAFCIFLIVFPYFTVKKLGSIVTQTLNNFYPLPINNFISYSVISDLLDASYIKLFFLVR